MTQYECMDDMTIEQELDKVNDMIEAKLVESKANIFKILGDLNRVKIVELLAHYNKLCVY